MFAVGNIVNSEYVIELYSLHSLEIIDEIPSPNRLDNVLSSDNSLLAILEINEKGVNLKIWDLNIREVIMSFPSIASRAMKFSPDNQILVLRGATFGDNHIVIYNLKTQEVKNLPYQEGEIIFSAWQPVFIVLPHNLSLPILLFSYSGELLAELLAELKPDKESPQFDIINSSVIITFLPNGNIILISHSPVEEHSDTLFNYLPTVWAISGKSFIYQGPLWNHEELTDNSYPLSCPLISVNGDELVLSLGDKITTYNIYTSQFNTYQVIMKYDRELSMVTSDYLIYNDKFFYHRKTGKIIDIFQSSQKVEYTTTLAENPYNFLLEKALNILLTVRILQSVSREYPIQFPQDILKLTVANILAETGIPATNHKIQRLANFLVDYTRTRITTSDTSLSKENFKAKVLKLFNSWN